VTNFVHSDETTRGCVTAVMLLTLPPT
jgi:hypothetical protein